MGAGHPRDINPEGRELNGVHFAMEFLSQQNQIIMGEKVDEKSHISVIVFY